MHGQYEANKRRFEAINGNLVPPNRRIISGDARAVVKKGRFLDSFSFQEDCFVRIEEHICWQTQRENEQLEHFDVLPQVDLCVRPTHLIAEHALTIFTIRHQRVIYFLAVELIPTGEKGANEEINVVLNYVVLKNYPENVKPVNYYTVKPRTKVNDLLAHGADFLINRSGIYNLLKNNCFHYVEHILEGCCEDYDKRALKDLGSFKKKGRDIVLSTAMAIITLFVTVWMTKNGNLNMAKAISRFKFIR